MIEIFWKFLIFLILQIILIHWLIGLQNVQKNLKENFFLLKVNIVWRIFNRQKFRKHKDNLDKEFNAAVQKGVLERLKEEKTFKAKTKKPLTYFIKSHPDIDVYFKMIFFSFFIALAAILLQADFGPNAISIVLGFPAGLYLMYAIPTAIIQFIRIVYKWRSQV